MNKESSVNEILHELHKKRMKGLHYTIHRYNFGIVIGTCKWHADCFALKAAICIKRQQSMAMKY